MSDSDSVSETEKPKRRKHASRNNIMKELNKYSFHIKVKEKVSELAKKLKLDWEKAQMRNEQGRKDRDHER